MAIRGTPLPEVVWRPLYKWSSPEAERLYHELQDKAQRAAKAAAEPYLKQAEQVFDHCATPDHTLLDRVLWPLTPASKD